MFHQSGVCRGIIRCARRACAWQVFLGSWLHWRKNMKIPRIASVEDSPGWGGLTLYGRWGQVIQNQNFHGIPCPNF